MYIEISKRFPVKLSCSYLINFASQNMALWQIDKMNIKSCYKTFQTANHNALTKVLALP